MGKQLGAAPVQAGSTGGPERARGGRSSGGRCGLMCGMCGYGIGSDEGTRTHIPWSWPGACCDSPRKMNVARLSRLSPEDLAANYSALCSVEFDIEKETERAYGGVGGSAASRRSSKSKRYGAEGRERRKYEDRWGSDMTSRSSHRKEKAARPDLSKSQS